MRYGSCKKGRCPQVWTAVHLHALKVVNRIMPGGWEGGSLTALGDSFRQMHARGRMVVIYKKLGIVWDIFCYENILVLFPVLRIV